MRILTLTFLLSVLQLAMNAQLYNQGATIKVQPGAMIFVQGEVQNNAGGSISNDGKIEVQGSFTNAATYTSATADDSLILSGGGNVNLNGGASTYNYLVINKTANTNVVKLTGSTTVNTKLDYLSGNFTTDPILNPTFVLSSPVTAVYNFAAGREITGRVRRTGWTNGAARVFNQPNMQVTTAGGTNPSDLTVLMIPETEGGDPSLAEREVKRRFGFTQTGGTGFTADIRFPYIGTELNTNTEANLVPWQLITSEWNGRLTPVTRDGTNDYISTTSIAGADLANEWKLADPRYTFNVTAYLKGAWNNPTGLMRTTLNANGLLPLTQPYNLTGFQNYNGGESVASIPNANVVDWVLVEFRKPASGLPTDATNATAVGRKAAFLLNNGTIVDLDGVTPLSFDINRQGAGFFVVRHRNHLGIMSNSLPSNTSGTYANSFNVQANYYTNGAATSGPGTILNAAAPGSTIYGMWPGDVNVSRSLTSTDVSLINATLSGPASGNTNVYSSRDITLDRNVTSADISQANASLAGTAQQNPPLRNGVVTPREKKVESHVPGE